MNALKNKYRDLTAKGLDITIQYIPLQVGVPGNEIVDELPKTRHNKNETQFPSHKTKNQGENQRKLGIIKTDLKKWSWTKKL